MASHISAQPAYDIFSIKRKF